MCSNQNDEFPGCDICGGDPGSSCQCPECPVCGIAGNPACVGVHMPAWFWPAQQSKSSGRQDVTAPHEVETPPLIWWR